jgi:PPM family protein phosphatase
LHEAESDSQSITNQGMRLQPNDRLLLCSDGLTDLVEPSEILAAYREQTMEEATAFLIDLANQRGGHDNITVVVVQTPATLAKPAAAAPVPFMTSLSRFALIGCLGAIILGVLAGGVFGGWILYTRSNATATPTQQATLPGIGRTRTATTTATVSQTRTPSPTATGAGIPLAVPSHTPSQPLDPVGPTLTPWPTNTPGTPLPVVTVISP